MRFVSVNVCIYGHMFFSTHSFVLMASKCCRHPLPNTHTSLALIPLFLCPRGQIFTLAIHESRRQRGVGGGDGGRGVGGFHAVTGGSAVKVDSDTKHTA